MDNPLFCSKISCISIFLMGDFQLPNLIRYWRVMWRKLYGFLSPKLAPHFELPSRKRYLTYYLSLRQAHHCVKAGLELSQSWIHERLPKVQFFTLLSSSIFIHRSSSIISIIHGSWSSDFPIVDWEGYSGQWLYDMWSRLYQELLSKSHQEWLEQ